jgi:hypothetical protein
MFSVIRKRVTYANVAMTLALVFAMSGGAYAASKYLITSTKQISPKVLKQLKGAKGPKGETGAAGAAGKEGPAGKEGAPGKAGANGTNGKDGESVASTALKPGEQGCAEGGSKFTVGGKTTTACDGKEGKPGSIHPGETLPSEASETGTWAVSMDKPSCCGIFTASSPISFAVPLKTEIPAANVHLIGAGGNGTGGGTCPTSSSAEKPEAEPGNLCIFIGVAENVSEYWLLNPAKVAFGHAGQVPAATTGIDLAPHAEEAEAAMLAAGTWAVTAE